MNIFITTLKFHTLDKRYREEWDYKIHCSRIPNENEHWRKWDYLYEITSAREETTSIWLLEYEKAKQYFQYYDTYEKVEPRAKSRMEWELLDGEPMLRTKRAHFMLKQIKKDMIDNTKNSIKLALMDNNFDKIWADTCYLINQKYYKNK